MGTKLAGVILALALALGACRVMGHAEFTVSTVVYTEPPAPKVERTGEPRDGFAWVAGRWEAHGDQWTWIEGHYDRVRTGYAWTDGRWERRGNSWYWIDGQWAAAAPTVRDHREVVAPTPATEQDPTVRDHRD